MTDSLLRRTLIGICSILLLASCQQKDGINCFQPVNVEGWHTQDMVTFDIPTLQNGTDYDLQVQVRLVRQYAYKDLWLVATQTYTSTKEENRTEQDIVLQDTVHLQLTDQEGNLTGDGKNLITYKAPIHFIRLGKGMSGQIRLHHIMNEKCIRGVHDIGVELLPLEFVAPSINTQQDEKQDGESPQG